MQRLRRSLCFLLTLTLLFTSGALAFALPAGTLTPETLPGLRAAALAAPNGSALSGGLGANAPISLEGRAHLLMIAYLALETLEPDATLTVGNGVLALPQRSVRIGLDVGNQLSVRAAAAALMLYGAQDAALVFAQALSGGGEGLVRLLNETAAELGMADTRFINATGAYDAGQYTTAQDLLRLVAAARGNETLRTLLTQPATVLEAPRSTLPATLDNPFSLIDEASPRYDGRVGLVFAFDPVRGGETLVLLEGGFGGEETLLAAARLQGDGPAAAALLSTLLDHWDGDALPTAAPPAPAASIPTPGAPVPVPGAPASVPGATAPVPETSAPTPVPMPGLTPAAPASEAPAAKTNSPLASLAPSSSAKIEPAPIYEPLPDTQPVGLMARWGWLLWLALAAATAVGSWYFFGWLNRYFL